MRSLDEIKADMESNRRRVALEEEWQKLREEERMARESGHPVNLTADEEEPKVKVEEQQGLEIDADGQIVVDRVDDDDGDGSHHMRDQATWARPPRNRNIHYPTPSSRDTMSNRSHHETRTPLDRQSHVGGPQERLGSARRPSTGFGEAYGTDFQQSIPAAAHQPYTGGHTGQEDPFRRPGDRQLHQKGPDRGSTYGSFGQYPTPAGNSTAAHRNVAIEPGPRRQQSFLGNSQRMYGPGASYGHIQSQQEGQMPEHHPLQQVPPGRQDMMGRPLDIQPQQEMQLPRHDVLQQVPSGRQDMMGRPLHIMGQAEPVQAQITASALTGVANHRYDKHPTFPTLVEKPDGTGYWELRCYVCGGNVLRSSVKMQNGKPSGGQFFLGISGFRGHIRICHPAELDEDQKISTATLVERCKFRELTHAEAIAMRHKQKGAYRIEKKAGAVADEGAAVRREHPWKRRKTNVEEEIPVEAKSRRIGAKSTAQDKKQKRTQQQTKRKSKKANGKKPQRDEHYQGGQDQNEYKQDQDEHEQDQNEDDQDQDEHNQHQDEHDQDETEHNQNQDEHDQDQHEYDQDQDEHDQDQIEHFQDDRYDSDYAPDADVTRRRTRGRTREQASSRASAPSVGGNVPDRGEQPPGPGGIDATEQGPAEKDASPNMEDPD